MGIIVLDFGGQYAHLLANRIRRLRVFAEIRSPTTDGSELAEADGLILSGGPSSVYDEEAPRVVQNYSGWAPKITFHSS